MVLSPCLYSSRNGWPSLQYYDFSWQVPENLPPGQYLVRLEHIAIHNAWEQGEAQFYTSCAQIEVGGEGTGVPGPLVKIPGLYSETDPGILFNGTRDPPE